MERVRLVEAKVTEPTIAAMWASYRSMVLEPSGIVGTQLQESRRLFYTGCYAMLSMMHQISQASPSEEQACRTLDAMEQEWREFIGKVARGEEGY